MSSRLSRRGFLTGVGAGAAGVGLAACAPGSSGASSTTGTSGAATDVRIGAPPPPQPVYVPFHGKHQTGITTRGPAAGLMASFNVVGGAADLEQVLRDLSGECRKLMSGEPYPDRGEGYPPLYTGSLGAEPPPADLSIIVALGASVFDGRFGLAERRPKELVEMPFLANDRLDPALSHGDLLLNISSDTPDVNIFALRQLMRKTRDVLVLRWMVDGFNRRDHPEPGKAGVRNLMGFRDGTANLDPGKADVMDRHVWVAEGDGEPAWATGGSYMAVRLIRMFVERWDRTRLGDQEAIIGRRKESGAPFNGRVETDLPDYRDDPDGKVTPVDAHIRLANPRTPETDENLILRRGFSYSRGFDGSGNLDQGLAFISFQRSLEKGFLAVQERLNGEPLEEYIMPVGGGFFFALPGVDGDGYLGDGLFTP